MAYERCEFDPTEEPYCNLGMFHCPACAEMVVGRVPHPDYTLMNDPDFGPDPLGYGFILDDGPFLFLDDIGNDDIPF